MAESKARLISKAFTSTGDIRAENLDAVLDSADVVILVDSAYVSARAGASGLDSAASLALISGGNAITVTSGVVNHDDTSSQASVNNSGSNFIQDITLDDYGHVTAITSAEAGGGGGGLGDYGAVNSTGTAASAIGTDAIAIGEDAHAIQTREISIGTSAGREVSGCWYGVNIGYYAGRHMIGNYGICIGNLAGGSTTNYGPKSGENNIAIGHKAMTGFESGSGYGNIAIGSTNGNGIMYNLSSGYNNVVTGSGSGYNITTGWGNVVIGAEAGVSITTGHRNTIVGRASGGNVNTGFFNILIGSSNSASASGVSRDIVIGNFLTGKGADTAFIGGTSGAYNGANSSSWSTTSDERIKTNVTDYTLGLDTLNQINVKTYNYLSDSDIATAHPELADSDGLVHEGLNTEKTIVGLMAQELEAVLPNSVTTRDNGIKAVNKDELFWVMLNSIKELKTANDSLVARVEALENA